MATYTSSLTLPFGLSKQVNDNPAITASGSGTFHATATFTYSFNNQYSGSLYFSASAGTVWDDGGTADWATTSGGPYNTTWGGGADAVFEGTGGAVSVGTVSANSLTFKSGVTGYDLESNSMNLTIGAGGVTANESANLGTSTANAATIALGASQTWTVAAGKTLGWANCAKGPGSQIAGGVTLTKEGDGTLQMAYPTIAAGSGNAALRRRQTINYRICYCLRGVDYGMLPKCRKQLSSNGFVASLLGSLANSTNGGVVVGLRSKPLRWGEAESRPSRRQRESRIVPYATGFGNSGPRPRVPRIASENPALVVGQGKRNGQS